MNSRNPLITLFAYLGVTLAAQAGNLLLLKLSQFGQNPFPELPLVVILMFGLLFANPSFHLSQSLKKQGLNIWAVVTAAVLLNVGLTAVLLRFSEASGLYLLAPLMAMTLGELYKPLFRKHAAMIAAMTVYIVCTLLANYTFDSFLPLPGYGLINVGTLFFGITFTQRDRVHRYGRKNAYAMIFVAALANVILALTLGTPIRYVIVGFSAITLSESADTEVYQRFIKHNWLTRVATSNAVSIPIDTVVFTVFAFAGEAFATPGWMLEVILTDIMVKLVVGTLAAVRIMRKGTIATT